MFLTLPHSLSLTLSRSLSLSLTLSLSQPLSVTRTRARVARIHTPEARSTAPYHYLCFSTSGTPMLWSESAEHCSKEFVDFSAFSLFIQCHEGPLRAVLKRIIVSYTSAVMIAMTKPASS